MGFKNPHEYREAERDSPKGVVRTNARLMSLGFFFFFFLQVSSVVYFDMLEIFVFPQLEELQSHVFLQQNGEPPY